MTPPGERNDYDSVGPVGADRSVDLNQLFEVLADEHRRSALRSLSHAGGELPFDALVDDIARDVSVEPPDGAGRRAVATRLYHVHLPKLSEAGLVAEFDPDDGVTIGDDAADLPDRLDELT